MQGESGDIIALLEDGIDAILEGNRGLYNRLVTAAVEEGGRHKTYRRLHQSFIQRAQRLEDQAKQAVGSEARDERNCQARQLRDEAVTISSCISPKRHKDASPPVRKLSETELVLDPVGAHCI